MLIRKAHIEDAEAIATYILLAMEEIVYQFIGEESRENAKQFLTNLICKKNNQYSYENCWVMELNQELVAIAVIYDGALLQTLRAPVAQEIKILFNKDFNPENETEAGEFYIDSIAVSPQQQGQGFGAKLLQFLIDEYVTKRNETLGLLVDKENPNAKKLYLKLGFKMMGEKTLAGKRMEHFQFRKVCL